MKGEELDKALDEWLDRASAEYGTAETRLGFEARVIANVNSRLEKRRWRFRRLSLATAATAVVIFACYVFLAHVQEHPAIETALDKPQKPRSGLLDRAPREQLPSITQAASSTKQSAARRVPSKAREIPNRSVSVRRVIGSRTLSPIFCPGGFSTNINGHIRSRVRTAADAGF